MGYMKKLQMEADELAYSKHLEDLKREADELYPDDDWDPEDYEAWKAASEKGD